MRISPSLMARATRAPNLGRPETKDPDQPGRPTDRVAFVAGLVARRDAMQASREQVKALRGKVLDKPIADTLAALRQRMAGAPPLVAGMVIVRLVGRLRGGRQARLGPLAGITVRLGATADKTGVERESDAQGVVVFDPTEAASGEPPRTVPSEIQVLAPEGTVIGRRRLTPDEVKAGLSVVMEIAESSSIAPAFAAAERWGKAQDAAEAKAESVRASIDKAMPLLETELKALQTGLDKAIEAVSGTKRTLTGTTRRRTTKRSDA